MDVSVIKVLPIIVDFVQDVLQVQIITLKQITVVLFVDLTLNILQLPTNVFVFQVMVYLEEYVKYVKPITS